jgi:hypothetical protein
MESNYFRIETGDKDLAVAANLPEGYLAVKPLGLGKGVSRWV